MQGDTVQGILRNSFRLDGERITLKSLPRSRLVGTVAGQHGKTVG